MLSIKILDTINALYEPNYLENKVFTLFWERDKNAIANLGGADDSFVNKGLYLQLAFVQSICDWFFLLMYWIVFILASTYGLKEARKDTMQSNVMSIFVWLLIANVIGIFIFYLWAKIASLAMFMPTNGDIISKIIEGYKELMNFSS